LDGNNYHTTKKLNVSDDTMFQVFDSKRWKHTDAEDGVYAVKRSFPSRAIYYNFSEKLKGDSLKSRHRKADRLITEADAI
jgi:hypothetical protein